MEVAPPTTPESQAGGLPMAAVGALTHGRTRSKAGFVVPKGILHRTRAIERTVILMVENVGIVPARS